MIKYTKCEQCGFMISEDITHFHQQPENPASTFSPADLEIKVTEEIKTDEKIG